MLADDLLQASKEVLRSKIGRTLVLSVALSLVLLGVAILVPVLSKARNEGILRVVDAETARVEALLESRPPTGVMQQIRVRPLMLGLEIRKPDGSVLAHAGQGDFSVRRLQGPGRKILHGDGHVDIGFDVQRHDGTWRAFIRCHTRPVENDLRKGATGLVVIVLIISLVAVALTVFVLRRKVLVPLEHQARHDSLTSLPNRAHFDERLRQVIDERLRDGGTAALMFIDLDRFKDFNDNFGHPQGDALLRELASRLEGAVAADCMAARLGGDEFAVILPYVENASEALTQGERILEILSRHYRYNQFKFLLSASIGIAILPDQGKDPASAQRNADIAMYVAKRAGRARVVMFDAAMSDAVSRRKQIEDWLRHALDHHELALHYQPKLSMDGERIEGAEALLRWTRPETGPIAPDEFIPVAEESGLIVPLGLWVLTRVLWQINQWRDVGFVAPRIAINVSANQFLDAGFLESFMATLSASGLPASQLDMEITESALITSPEQAVAMLHDIRKFGVTVSLDDFGTGYSSLSYLKRFPVDAIKIDKSFISDLADDEDSARLVQAVIGMTHSLGLKLVAEGVETEAQIDLLRAWGCDQYQGHVSSRAIDAGAFQRFCEARLARVAEPA